ncbi:MAG: FAD-dependent oxidoreductase [Phycisphaerales bacterium]
MVHNYGHGGCGVTLCFGAAQLAADLVAEALSLPLPYGGEGWGEGAPTSPVSSGGTGVPPVSPFSPPLPSIAVLGGGVTALATARELLLRGHRVTCYAAKFACDTTSNIAGALWLPTGVEFGDRPEKVARFHDLLRRSRRAFLELDRAKWGVEELPVYEPAYAPHEERYFNNGTLEAPTPLERLPVPGPPRSGRVFNTDFIHTPRFLRTLEGDVRARGAKLVERTFTTRDELALLPEPLLVNCLALGSRELFDDLAMYPARGLLVHLKPQPLGYIVHDGYKYMFPREDALLLGGTFEPEIDDPIPDEHLCKQILAHHRRFFAAT